MAAPEKSVQLRTAMNSTKAIIFLPFLAEANVHSEGRAPLLRASLSTVRLGHLVILRFVSLGSAISRGTDSIEKAPPHCFPDDSRDVPTRPPTTPLTKCPALGLIS